MGEAAEADQKALIGCYNLLWIVSGKEPEDWYGEEEDQVVNWILNITDKQTVHSYAEMRQVTRDLTGLAKFQSGVGATPPMNSTRVSINRLSWDRKDLKLWMMNMMMMRRRGENVQVMRGLMDQMRRKRQS